MPQNTNLLIQKDYFSQDILNRIFTISAKYPDRLVSRESAWLEFKESFGFKSLGKYLRSAAAFANAKGGYIVYGVQNQPHVLVGLKDNSFRDMDPARFTQQLNEHFDPEISWDRHFYELNGKLFGLLHISESQNKPVICRKATDDGKSLREGEIYYRYSGRTQTIRYSELKELIEDQRRKEELKWFAHLKEISRVGISDAAIFDLKSGKVSNSEGHFFIDENLLSQISFIREGEFNETHGKPTLKVIGNAKPVSITTSAGHGGKPQIVKTKGIRTPDIILGFLKSERISDVNSYFSQICYESTAFLPFYYLLKQGRVSIDKAKTIVQGEPSTQPAKNKLLERLNDDSGLKLPMPCPRNASGQRKIRCRQAFLKHQIPANPDVKNLKDLLAIIRTLEKSEIDEAFVKETLLKWFNKHYANSDSGINHEIRRAFCYIDWLACFDIVRKLK